MPTHFDQEDFEQNFPDNVDTFPTAIDHENYVDAILINSLINSIYAIEEYLITWKNNIEEPCNPNKDHVYGISNYTGNTLQISITVNAQGAI